MKHEERVEHGRHRDQGEEGGRGARGGVAGAGEVEQPQGEGADEGGELQPGEEGALVGEEDLGLDARGQGDALAGRGLEERLRGHGAGTSRGRTWKRGNVDEADLVVAGGALRARMGTRARGARSWLSR